MALLQLGCDPSLELEFWRSSVATGRDVLCLVGTVGTWAAEPVPGPYPDRAEMPLRSPEEALLERRAMLRHYSGGTLRD